MNDASGSTSTPDRFADAWNAFWFMPRDVASAARLRIAIGIAVLCYLLQWTPDLERFIAPSGILPAEVVSQAVSADPLYYPWRFSVLDYARSPSAVWGFHIAAFAAALLLTLGVAGRWMSILTLFVMLSYVHRAPLLMSPQEPLLCWGLLYLCIAPSSQRYSLDAFWARTARTITPSIACNVSVRLIQVHLSLHYFFVGITQLSDRSWWSGSAVWLLMAQSRTRGVDLTVLRESTFLLNGLTHFLVLLAFALALLPWTKAMGRIANYLVIPYVLLLTLLTGLWVYGLTLLALQIAFTKERTLIRPLLSNGALSRP